MVDIAIRALSPAENDPTTAVQVLGHLGDTLRLAGSTPAPDAAGRRGDAGGHVYVPVREWADVLSLGTTEIREYGASSVQVTRRLRAPCSRRPEAQVLPERRAAVDAAGVRLDATVTRAFGGREDLDLAVVPIRRESAGLPAERRGDASLRGFEG